MYLCTSLLFVCTDLEIKKTIIEISIAGLNMVLRHSQHKLMKELIISRALLVLL